MAPAMTMTFLEIALLENTKYWPSLIFLALGSPFCKAITEHTN